MRRIWTITVALLLLSSCIAMKSSNIEINGKTSAGAAPVPFLAKLTGASVINNKIILDGTDLDIVTEVRVTGPGGLNESFAIESKTATQLTAKALRGLAFGVDQLLQIVISNANGQAIFPVTFSLSVDSVSSSTILDGEVRTADLADGAVTSAKIADDGIALADMGSASVNSSKLVDGSVALVDLAADSVDSSKISNASITSADLATGSVTSTAILDSTIVTGDISDGTISSSDMAANSVSSSALIDGTVALVDMGPNSVDTGNIVDATIINSDLADGSIGSSKIIDGSVALTDMAADSVSSANIVNGTIGIGDMDNDSVGSVQVVDESLTSDDIGAASVGSSEIIDGSLATDDYGNSTVTSAKIFDGTIASDDLADDSITTDKIFDANVTEAKLASSSVTAAKLGTDAVTTGKIIDGAVNTSKILDDTILAVDLSDMGASNGQFLQYNGTTWVGADLSGLNFQDSWNATANTPTLSDLGVGTCPNLAGSVTCGDFFIVSTAGTTSLDGITTWGVGDWVMATDTGWTEVNSSQLVNSVFGRTGLVTAQPNDYTWAQIDKTTSDVDDITNVDTTGVANANDGLVWDGASKFTIQPLLLATGNTVTTSDIATSAVTDAKLASGIDASKITAGTLPDARLTANIPKFDGVTNNFATNLQVGGDNVLVAADINTSIQPKNDRLDEIAGLSPTLNNYIAGDGTDFILKTPTAMRTDLGLVIGVDVQAYDSELTTLAALDETQTNNFVVADGTDFIIKTPADSRAALGLGTAALEAVDNCSATEVLTGDGANFSCTTIITPNGATVANNLVRFDNTGGTVIKNSGVTVDDSNNVSGVVNLTSTGNLVVDTTTLVVDSTGDQVGIGIATPTEKIDVRGNARIGDGTTAGEVKIFGDANYVSIKAPAGVGSNITFTLPNSTGASGNVLTATGSGGMSWLSAGAGSGLGDVAGPSTSNDNGIILFDGTTGKIIKDSTVIINATQDLSGLRNLTLTGDVTADTNTLFVDSTNDKVGVGSITPEQALDVRGKVAIGDETNAAELILRSTDATEEITITVPPIGTLTPYTLVLPVDDGTADQVLKTDGSGVLAWTTISADNIVDADSSTKIETLATAETIQFTTNSLERMRIDSSGNLGVGTTSPGEKLDVRGNARIGDGSTAGEVKIYGDANYVSLKAPAGVGSDLTFILPDGAGTTGQVLTKSSTANTIEWTTPTVGTVTSIIAGTNGLTGGTITTTGTIDVDFTKVQAQDGQLDDVAGLTPTANNFVVSDASNLTLMTPANSRTAMGLGSIATQAANAVTITGGTVDGTNVGATTPGTGAFSSLGIDNISIDSNNIIFDSGASALIGVGAAAGPTYTQRVRLTAGDTDTFDNSKGASIDLHGIDHANAGALDLVSGGTASMTFWTNNTNQMTLDSSGRLGLGIASPTSILHIKSTDSPTIDRTDDDDVSKKVISLNRSRSSATAPAAGFGSALGFALEGFLDDSVVDSGQIHTIWENTQSNNTTDRDSSLTFHTMVDDTLAEKVRIDSDGNMGLGITSPTSKLHVVGTGKFTGALDMTSQLISNVLNPVGAQDAATKNYVDTQVSASSNEIKDGDGSSKVDTDDTADVIAFDTTSLERMRIDASGNVGIGTISPSTKLHIVGTGKFTGALDMTSQLINNVLDPVGAQDAATKNYVDTQVNEIKDADGSSKVDTDDEADVIAFDTTSLERMRIDASGNVGIGTITPGNLLEVGDGTIAGTTSVEINRKADEISGLVLSDVGTEKWFVGELASSNDLIFRRDGTTSDMVINASGNVGVGATTVDEKLHIETSGATDAKIKIEAVTGEAGLSLLAGSGATNKITRVDFLNGATSATVPRWSILNDFAENGTNDFRFINQGGATSVLTLSQNGKVGIGTNIPAQTLQIESSGSHGSLVKTSGTNNFAQSMVQADNGTIQGSFLAEGTNANTAGIQLKSVSAHPLSFWTNDIEKLTITAAGEVGIGTTTPDSSTLLDMSSTTKGFRAPSMNTSQRDAISSPASGLVIFNSTDSKYNFYNGASWAELGSGGGGSSTSNSFAVEVFENVGTNEDVSSGTEIDANSVNVVSNTNGYPQANYWTGSRFKAPANGTYLVYTSLFSNETTAGSYRTALYVMDSDGTTVSKTISNISHDYVSGNGTDQLTGLDIIQMTTGQQLKWEVSTGSNFTMYKADDHTYLRIALLNTPSSTNLFADTDTDTKIQVEKNPDEDMIRFDIGGVTPIEDMFKIDNTGVTVKSGYKFFGDGSGLSNIDAGSFAADAVTVDNTDFGSTTASSAGLNVPSASADPTLNVAGAALSAGDKGQFYFNTTDNNLKVYDGSAWVEVGSGGGGSSTVADADADTKIQIEETADEDKIRFDTDGSERMTIDNLGNIGIGTSSPAASTLLDMSSTTKGFRAPSMTTTQRDAIASPATGLLIYNSTDNKYNYYDGSAWTEVGSGSGGGAGPVKYLHANQITSVGGSTTDPATGFYSWRTDFEFTNSGFTMQSNNERIRINTAGVYLINAHGRHGNGGYSGIEIFKNGTLVSRMDGSSNGTTPATVYDQLSTSYVGNFSINDYIEIKGTNVHPTPNVTYNAALSINSLSGSTGTTVADADGDTKIQVEEAADEDKIRFDTGGTERAVIDSSGFTLSSGVFSGDGSSLTSIPLSSTNFASTTSTQEGINIPTAASAPTKDSEGNTLSTDDKGQFYYNTTDSALKVWDGDSWESIGSGSGGGGSISSPETLVAQEDITVNVSSGQAIVSWPTVEGAVYHVYYSTSQSQDLTATAQVTTTAQSATVTGLTDGQTYYFYVKAVVAPASARVVVRPGVSLTYNTVLSADGVAGATGTLAVTVIADGSATGYKFTLTDGTTPVSQVQVGTSYTFTGVSRYKPTLSSTSVLRTSALAVYQVTAGHGIVANDSVKIEGFTNTTFNGDMVVESITSATISVYQYGQADASDTSGQIKRYQSYSLSVNSLDNITDQNVLLTSSTLSLKVSEKYFVENNGGYWGYSLPIFSSTYNLYGPRTLEHYRTPSSYTDWIYSNTLFSPMVGLRQLPNVLVSPKQVASQTVPVYAIFNETNIYGSAFYLENSETTTNQLSFSSQGSITLVLDDSDSIFEMGDGRVMAGTTSQNPYPSQATGGTIIERNLTGSTTGNLGSTNAPLPTLTTTTERLGQARFEATNNGGNKNIIVWADLVNQRFAWYNDSSERFATFSSLGITIANSTTRDNLAVVSDGIDKLLIVSNGSGTAYTIQFDWVNNLASLKATHASHTDDMFFSIGTEEDSFGATLHTVNGKIFYLDTVSSNSVWAVAGSVFDPTTSGKITHTADNFGGGGSGSGVQSGTDTLHGVSSTLSTSVGGITGYKAILTDKDHDAHNIFVDSGADNKFGYGLSNILCLPRGNGVY